MKMRDKAFKKHPSPRSLAMIAQSKTHGKGPGLLLAMDFAPFIVFSSSFLPLYFKDKLSYKITQKRL